MKLILTQEKRQQYALHIWGPGSTDKSTSTDLLKNIMGTMSCTIDSSRITNILELNLIEDEYLVVAPDIPPFVNSMQCSLLNKIITGENLTNEFKCGLVREIASDASVVVAANQV